MQRAVLEAQRAELALQREVAENQHDTARRVAEAAMREQHRRLLQMAIDDPLLMAVWPGYGSDTSEDLCRQFMYANLIISYQYMCWETGYLANHEIEDTLHYIFASPKVQEFWEKTRAPRDLSSPHSGTMREFYDICELAYQRQILGLATGPGPDDLTESR